MYRRLANRAKREPRNEGDCTVGRSPREEKENSDDHQYNLSQALGCSAGSSRRCQHVEVHAQAAAESAVAARAVVVSHPEQVGHHSSARARTRRSRSDERSWATSRASSAVTTVGLPAIPPRIRNTSPSQTIARGWRHATILWPRRSRHVSVRWGSWRPGQRRHLAQRHVGRPRRLRRLHEQHESPGSRHEPSAQIVKSLSRSSAERTLRPREWQRVAHHRCHGEPQPRPQSRPDSKRVRRSSPSLSVRSSARRDYGQRSPALSVG